MPRRNPAAGPRVDPYGVFPDLLRLGSRELGTLASPLLAACRAGRASLHQRHLLDLIGYALRAQEWEVGA